MNKCHICRSDLKPDSNYCSQCGSACAVSPRYSGDEHATEHMAPEEAPADHNRPREIGSDDLSFNAPATPVERFSDDGANALNPDAKPPNAPAAHAPQIASTKQRATRKALSTAALFAMMVVVSAGMYFVMPRLLAPSSAGGVTIGDAPKSITTGEDAMAALERERAEKQQELDGLKQKVSDAISQLNQKTSQVSQEQDELAKTQKESKAAREEFKAIREKLGKLKSELAEVESSLATFRAEVAMKRNELSSLEASIRKRKREERTLEASIRKHKRDDQKLSDKVAATKKEIQKLDDQITSGERRAKRLRRDIDGLRKYDAGR